MVNLKSKDLINTILSILSEFSLQTLDEICELLPSYDRKFIAEKIEFLIYQLLAVRKVTFDGVAYYIATKEDVVLQNYRKEEYFSKRRKLFPILKFIRWMCNNEKYDIDYAICGEIPNCASSLVIVNCNCTLYDIYYIPSENIDFMASYINLISRESLRNYVNKNGSADGFQDDVQRIIITDDEKSLRQINLPDTKYKIYFEEDNIIFSGGDANE